MSVPKWRRDTHENGKKRGWLDVTIAAEKLLKHTMQKISGRKGREYFAKADTFTKRIPLLQTAEKIYHDCKKANLIRVKTKADYEKRHDLQIEALLSADDLLTYLTIFNEEKPIENLEAWVALEDDVEKRLRGWIRSDMEKWEASISKDIDGNKTDKEARNQWLRSPNPGNANNVRNVNTSGALNNNNANNTNAVAPDCMDSQTE